jgi:hypothetical protein
MPNAELGFNIIALDRASKTFLALASNVDRLSRKLDELDRKRANPRVDVSTARAHSKLTALERRLDSLSRGRFLINVAVAAAPLAIPAIAAGVLGGGAAAAMGSGLLAGVGGFAAVAAGQLKIIKDTMKEAEKLAKEGHQKAARMTLATLSRLQLATADAITELKDAWSDFLASGGGRSVLKPLVAGMEALAKALPALGRFLKPVSTAFAAMFDILGDATATRAFKKFADTLGEFSAGMVSKATGTVINLAKAFGNLFEAFMPLGNSMADGLVSLTAKFERWTATVGESRGFKQFVAYVKRNGPELAATFAAIGRALINIAKALAPLAEDMLRGVRVFAEWVARVADAHPVLVRIAGSVAVFTAALSAIARPASAFVGAINTVVDVARGARTAFRSVAANVQTMNAVFPRTTRLLSGVAGVGTAALSSMADTTTKTGKALAIFGDTASGALMGFAAGGPIGAAIGGGAGLLLGLGRAFLTSGNKAEVSAEDIDSYRQTLNRTSGAITRTTKAHIAWKLEQAGVLRQLRAMGIDTAVAVEAVRGNERAVHRLTEAFDSQLRAIQRRRAAIMADNRIMGHEQDALDRLKQREEALIAARRRATDAVGRETEAVRRAQEGHGRLSDALNGVQNKASVAGAEMGDFKNRLDRTRGGVEQYTDKLRKVPKDVKTEAEFNDARARGKVNSFVQDLASKLRGIKDESVRISLASSAQSILQSARGLNIFGRAEGGPIKGPGTAKSDSILARLSNGEHVMTAEEVQKAGGHSAVFGIRRMIKRGEFRRRGDVPAFADGGAVVVPEVHSSGNATAVGIVARLASGIADSIGDAISAKLNKALQFSGGVPLGPGGSLSAGQVVRAQQFARAQAGKPYIWGGVGPGGYDCSGFPSAILNYALGRYPHSRLGTTSTMPWPGFTAGLGMFSSGWFTGSPGHMSSNVGGMGAESAGGVGVRLGGAATRVTSFPRVAHFDAGGVLPPGVTLARNDSGSNELVLTHKEVKALAKAFQLARGMSGKQVRGEFNELLRGLRNNLGDRAPLVRRIERLADVTVLSMKSAEQLRKSLDKAKAGLADARGKFRDLRTSSMSHYAAPLFGEGQGLEAFGNAKILASGAKAFETNLRRLRRKGLDQSLIAQIARSTDFDSATELAKMSRTDLARLNRLNRIRLKAARSVGDFAAHAVFGDDVRGARQRVNRIRRARERSNDRLDARERRTEVLLNRADKRDIGREMRRAIDGARIVLNDGGRDREAQLRIRLGV